MRPSATFESSFDAQPHFAQGCLPLRSGDPERGCDSAKVTWGISKSEQESTRHFWSLVPLDTHTKTSWKDCVLQKTSLVCLYHQTTWPNVLLGTNGHMVLGKESPKFFLSLSNTDTHLHSYSALPKKERKVLVTQSCLTLYNPMDSSWPDSSVHRIPKTYLLERRTNFSPKSHPSIWVLAQI